MTSGSEVLRSAPLKSAAPVPSSRCDGLTADEDLRNFRCSRGVDTQLSSVSESEFPAPLAVCRPRPNLRLSDGLNSVLRSPFTGAFGVNSAWPFLANSSLPPNCGSKMTNSGRSLDVGFPCFQNEFSFIDLKMPFLSSSTAFITRFPVN